MMKLDKGNHDPNILERSRKVLHFRIILLRIKIFSKERVLMKLGVSKV